MGYRQGWSRSMKTGQLRQMQFQPWFQFARIIRNCLSHDFRFDLSKDMRLLPVTWKGKNITGGVHGTRLEHSFFGFNDVLPRARRRGRRQRS